MGKPFGKNFRWEENSEKFYFTVLSSFPFITCQKKESVCVFIRFVNVQRPPTDVF